MACWGILGGFEVLGKVGKEGFARKVTFQKREREQSGCLGNSIPCRGNRSEPLRGRAQQQQGVGETVGRWGSQGMRREAKFLRREVG